MSASRPPRIAFAVFWLLMAGLSFCGLNRGLWTPDEPREAEIGREMLLRPGAVPDLNGAPFFEKPPLYYWFLASAYGLTGGPSAGAARAVSALFGFLTLVITFHWSRRAFSREAAFVAVFMLATCLEFLYSTHWILLDPALMFFSTAALWAAWEMLQGASGRFLILLYAFLVLSLWTKGPAGLAMPASGLLAYLIWRRKEKPWRALRPQAGAAILLAALGALLLAFYWEEGYRGLYQFVWVNHVERIIHPVGTGHDEPFYFYAQQLPLALLPWLVPFLALFQPAFWKRAMGEKQGSRIFIAVGAAVPLLLLSIASTKRETYLLPILPLLAMLMATATLEAMASDPEKQTRFQRWSFGHVQPVILSLWGLALPVGLLVYTHSTWSSYLLAAVVAGIAGAMGWSWGRSGRLRQAWDAHRLSAGVFCLSALLLLVPLLDKDKNIAPFAQWLDGQLPKGAPILALGADETLCGIIPFVTGREVRALNPAEFRALAASKERPGFVAQQGDPRSPTPCDPSREGYVKVKEASFGPNRYILLWRDVRGQASE